MYARLRTSALPGRSTTSCSCERHPGPPHPYEVVGVVEQADEPPDDCLNNGANDHTKHGAQRLSYKGAKTFVDESECFLLHLVPELLKELGNKSITNSLLRLCGDAQTTLKYSSLNLTVIF